MIPRDNNTREGITISKRMFLTKPRPMRFDMHNCMRCLKTGINKCLTCKGYPTNKCSALN